MPLIVCDKCECVANTTESNYWSHGMDIWPEGVRGQVLCEDCFPPTYASGSPVPPKHESPRKKSKATIEGVARSSAHFIHLGRFEAHRTRAYGDHEK